MAYYSLHLLMFQQIGDGGVVPTKSLDSGTKYHTAHGEAMPSHQASQSGTNAEVGHGGGTTTQASQTAAPATGYVRGRGRRRVAGAERGRVARSVGRGGRGGSSSRLRRLIFGAE
jgi:hypothetical protein